MGQLGFLICEQIWQERPGADLSRAPLAIIVSAASHAKRSAAGSLPNPSVACSGRHTLDLSAP
jgi:hypothetical protein